MIDEPEALFSLFMHGYGMTALQGAKEQSAANFYGNELGLCSVEDLIRLHINNRDRKRREQLRGDAIRARGTK